MKNIGQTQGIAPTGENNVGVDLVSTQNNLLWEALKKVDLYDLIKNSKDGLDTYV